MAFVDRNESEINRNQTSQNKSCKSIGKCNSFVSLKQKCECPGQPRVPEGLQDELEARLDRSLDWLRVWPPCFCLFVCCLMSFSDFLLCLLFFDVFHILLYDSACVCNGLIARAQDMSHTYKRTHIHTYIHVHISYFLLCFCFLMLSIILCMILPLLQRD